MGSVSSFEYILISSVFVLIYQSPSAYNEKRVDYYNTSTKYMLCAGLIRFLWIHLLLLQLE